MANVLIKRQLKKTGQRLRALRTELAEIDEQRLYLADDADDLEVRAVVAETSGARAEAREAGGHVAAMSRARAHAVAEIARLEARQDQLLDRLRPR